MCIICVKPSGVPIPSYGILSECWQCNSDGAGFAYIREGSNTVIIKKGFMKLKTLNKALKELSFKENDNVIIHFRFATHGLNDAGNCHPFPLSHSTDDLRAVQWQGDIAIAHNGVFGNMPCHETLSDTQKFISGVLCNPVIKDNFDNKAVQELILGYCGSSSKLAILRPSGILLIGKFIEDKGLYFSNNGFKKTVYNYPTNQYPSNSYYENKGFFGHMNYDNIDLPLDVDECILCKTKTDILWREEEDAFLCTRCAEFNLANNKGRG